MRKINRVQVGPVLSDRAEAPKGRRLEHPAEAPKARRRKGFTLIELLLVVVIIGLLAAIVVPRLAGRAEGVKIDTTRASMTELRKALGLYEVDNGRFPTQDQGLLALIEKPSSAPEPKKWRKYLETREIPKDAWGQPFDYKYPGEVNTDGYDIISTGPDETPGNDDDIVMP